MSKKKQKTVTGVAIAVKTAEVSRKLDEIIDLLNVLVDQTKKPEPPKRRLDFNIVVPNDAQAAQQAWEQDARESVNKPLLKKEPGDWHQNPRSRAAEEVEDYHGKATTYVEAGDRYVPVRVHP